MAAQGVWVAIDDDQVRGIFTTELLASRCALEQSCGVMFWPFGADVAQAREADKARRAKLTPPAASSGTPAKKSIRNSSEEPK